MVWNNFTTLLNMVFAYGLFFVIFPSVCLKPMVKSCPLSFRVVFYQGVSNIVMIAVSFAMAFMGVTYRRWHFWVLLCVLPLLIRAVYSRRTLLEAGKRAWTIYRRRRSGMINGIQIFRMGKVGFWDTMRSFCRRYLGRKLPEYLVLVGAGVWIIWYFGWFRMHNTGFASSDGYTHLYWTVCLMNGDAFPRGMYPHAMHFLCAALSSVTGLDITPLLLCFGVFNMLLVSVLIYSLVREIFSHWPPAAFAVLFFLLMNTFAEATYNRFQMTLPLEFGLCGMITMVYGLVSYMREKKRVHLALFMLGLVWSTQSHFHATIYAAFLCVGFGIVFLPRMLRSKRFVPVIIAGVLSIVLSFVPYVLGLALGFTFEQSIAWGFSVIEASTESSETTDDTSADTETTKTSYLPDTYDGNLFFREGFAADVERVLLTGFSSMFSSDVFSWVMIGLDALLFLYGLIGTVVCIRKKRESVRWQMYMAMSAMWFCGSFCVWMYLLGLPTVMVQLRAAIFTNVMACILLAAPLAMLMDGCGVLRLHPAVAKGLGTAAGAAVLVVCWQNGMLKSLSDLTYAVIVQEQDMNITQELAQTKEQYKWTLISPTQDTAMILYHGYHYETCDILIAIERQQEELYIPTEEVYIYVEKKVLRYDCGASRQTDGSDMESKTLPLTREMAATSLWDGGFYTWSVSNRDQTYYYQRQLQMSKIYFWAEKLRAVYPSQVDIYYEDDWCRVYRIRQESYFLLNLALDYSDMIEEGELPYDD